MAEEKQMEEIKKIILDFFEKMTIQVSILEASAVLNTDNKGLEGAPKNVVSVNIESPEPQILIGQGGQTLAEIQRLLRMILSKKTQSNFYLNLDINGYKSKKSDHLKIFAEDIANEVAFTKQEKVLSPMSSYERRIIHAELSNRDDVVTESRGEGQDRHIVVKPK